MIRPDTTPQLWVEQWWQSFKSELDGAWMSLRGGNAGQALTDAKWATFRVVGYIEECEVLGCRSVKEDIDAVRSLMALKYELRG